MLLLEKPTEPKVELRDGEILIENGTAFIPLRIVDCFHMMKCEVAIERGL